MRAVKSAAYQRDKDRILPKMKAYRQENAEKVSETKKRSRLKKYAEYRAKEDARYYENRLEILAKTKAARDANRATALEKERLVRQRHSAKRAAAQRAYYAENRESRSAYKLEYDKGRRKADPLYALAHLSRRRVTIALSAQGYLKTSPTREMLGCDYEQLAAHLEAQFAEGMTWKNRGAKGWHIDHIIPLASATTKEEMLKLCHYTNLQPLWAADNLAKGARV